MQKSVRLKSFELVAQNIADVDVELLHALSIAVGWPHRAADWELLRRAGQGIVAVDGIGRVFGSAMWFPHGTRIQAQGGGRWLMQQVLERCGSRNLALNATKAAHSLYRSLGFEVEARVYLHQGEVTPALPPLPPLDGELIELSSDRLDVITALDTQAFGTNRAELLALLAKNASIFVLERGGEVVGYSMKREFGRGYNVGPVIAANPVDAIHLTAVHLKSLVGHFARVDTREKDGPYAQFLVQSGLVVTETVTTMSKGRQFLHRVAGKPWVYGLAGHALS